MIERIGIVLLGLAIAAAAGGIIWAVRRSRLKRARLAAVYDERVEDTEPLPADSYSTATVNVGGRTAVQISELRVRTIPPAPVQSPAVRRHVGYMSDPPAAFGYPVPLASSDEPTSPSLFREDPTPAPADDGFKGGGGSFGGAGASGGWDSSNDPPSGGNEAA